MKETIKETKFIKEYEDKYGKKYLHSVKYADKEALYSSKKKEQDTFVPGQEAEFTETEREKNGRTTIFIKPVRKAFNSNFGRNLSKEQTRYSGFAVSYVKDLIIAGKIDLKDWQSASEKIFRHMVELDKTLQS